MVEVSPDAVVERVKIGVPESSAVVDEAAAHERRVIHEAERAAARGLGERLPAWVSSRHLRRSIHRRLAYQSRSSAAASTSVRLRRPSKSSSRALHRKISRKTLPAATHTDRGPSQVAGSTQRRRCRVRDPAARSQTARDGGTRMSAAAGESGRSGRRQVTQPTGEGTGFSIGRFAAAALTPSLDLDPSFGGSAAPLRLSVRLSRQHGAHPPRDPRRAAGLASGWRA